MDFDDLLVNMNILLENFPEILLKYQRKFEYILVDEYQDTNYCQYLILKHLAANNENICVVGDDAQSIYAFRGASIQNILNFRHDYPEHQVFKLEQNYRSTQNIVNAANSIIINNKDQIQKKIWTQNDTGVKLRLIRAKSDTEEGTLVVNAIFELKMNRQLGNEAFAILYRTNAQSRAFEESLRKLNIPYRIYGSVSFYQRKEIKDLLAYFRLANNNRDEDALARVINYPARGIGQTTVEKIIVAAGENQASAWEIIENPVGFNLNVNASTRHRLEEFVVMIKSFSTKLKSKNAYDLARSIATTSGILKDLYEDQSPEGVSRFENVEELLNAIREFCDTERPSPEPGEELPADLPAFRTLDEFMQDVALITDDAENHKEGRGDLIPCDPSRFIYEIDGKFLELPRKAGTFEQKIDFRKIPGADSRETLNRFTNTGRNLKKLSTFTNAPVSRQGDTDELGQLQPGMSVEHERFGKGKVLSIEGEGSNRKATVFFQAVGQKQLLLKFAKLKII